MQYMSDLHLERVKYEWDTKPVAPILILGGDIGRFCDYEKYADFLLKQCNKFDRVLLIAGNHEFYGSSREEGLKVATNLVNDTRFNGKLAFMHRTRIDFPEENVTILGCTLQSYIAPDFTRLTNDFARIQNWSVAKHNAEHDLDVSWLKQTLLEIAQEGKRQRVVIVSHYAPTYENTCHPGNQRNEVSQCFCSATLQAFCGWTGADQVSYWIFGHTHWNAHFKYRNIKVVSNQLCSDSAGLTWIQRRTLYRPFNERAVLQI